TPTVVWLLGVLNPLFSRITTAWHQRFPLEVHSGLYEKSDLIELVQQQRLQADNRVPAEVLELVNRALHFDTYLIRDIVRPRKQLRTLKASEQVGPVLLDELHATGQTDFPVCEKSADKIIGTLHVPTLDEAKQGGTVADYANRKLAFLHESDSLATALHAFYTTKQRLFVVVNGFDEYVGIVTLEDLMHVLIGDVVPSDFDAYFDRQAVAERHTSHHQSPEPDIEIPAETAGTVVE
ncbi:MAG TPA: CBS domain-containing protein, partial [Candidatus Saccharimonadales bacterium]|nr:CBS domain-containing protein [Candidatus Saccharimonadales bacterium]